MSAAAGNESCFPTMCDKFNEKIALCNASCNSNLTFPENWFFVKRCLNLRIDMHLLSQRGTTGNIM